MEPSCNTGWTLSYSLDESWAWISWHSYRPLFYLQSKIDFYSLESYSIISKHSNTGEFFTYYDNVYKFIIEFVLLDKALFTSLNQDIMFNTDAEYSIVPENPLDVRYVTFNEFYAYNSRQFTGVLRLKAADTFDYFDQGVIDPIDTITLRRKERDWHLNDFRDLVVNHGEPMFVEHCDGDVFIDKVPNDSIYSFDKPWNEQELMRDKYLIVRFSLSGINNLRLTLKNLINRSQNSER